MGCGTSVRGIVAADDCTCSNGASRGFGEGIEERMMDLRWSEEVARFLAVAGPRRTLVSAALAALVAGGGVAAIDEVAGRTRPGKRKERRQRRRNKGSRPPGAACDVCDDAGSCRYTSIQAAINAVSPTNPTIRVCKGTYKETVVIDRTVSLLGVPDAGGRPTIDGKGNGTTLTVTAGVTAVLFNFTITGGDSPAGGGVVNRGTLRLQGCEVTGNEASGQTFGNGGGILNTQQGVLFLADTVLTKNSAKADGSQGGAIFNDHGQVVLSGCLVSDNDAKLFGGGIGNAGGKLVLQATRVTKNDASNGGGIFNQSAGQVTLAEGSRVFDNDPNNCVGSNACSA
jgi:hypothetical protein